MADFHVETGKKAAFSKTVTEFDIYGFAGITGDFSPNHVDKAFMQQSPFGERIAHGALVVGFMSTACSMAIADIPTTETLPVSLGYDRIRFLKPVFCGDTLTMTYEIVKVDPTRSRSMAEAKAVNQRGELVCVAEHILKWVAAATPDDTSEGHRDV